MGIDAIWKKSMKLKSMKSMKSYYLFTFTYAVIIMGARVESYSLQNCDSANCGFTS